MRGGGHWGACGLAAQVHKAYPMNPMNPMADGGVGETRTARTYDCGHGGGGTRVGSTGTQGVSDKSDESDESDGIWWRGGDQNSEDIRMEARAYQTTTHRTAKRVAPISLARPASFPH